MPLWDWIWGSEEEVAPTVVHLRGTHQGGRGLLREYRQIATNEQGLPVFAEVIALESGSIGSGGGGTGGGGLTNSELRAAPVPVSGTVVTGGLTDAELRAEPVEVEGALSNAELRAEAVEIEAAVLPLPEGAATSAKQDVEAASLGAVTDAETSGNGSVIAVLKRLRTLLAGGLPATLGASGGLKVEQVVAGPTQPVSGPLTDTQLRAVAVPVSGPLTDAQLRALAVPVSLASVPSHAVTGPLTDAQLRAVAVPVSGPLTDAQLRASVVPVDATPAAPVATDYLPVRLTNGSVFEAVPTFKGRASTFRTPGRAGTSGQKILALHNASGSTKIVRINSISVDLVQTVVKAITVLPPVIRACKFTVLPTNGTVLGKVSRDSALASNNSIVVTGDASADGSGSGTTLTVTIPAGNILSQEYAPRFVTGAGYEPMDRTTFFEDTEVTLRALEGVVVFLDYVLATQNPTTDMWIATVDWDEF